MDFLCNTKMNLSPVRMPIVLTPNQILTHFSYISASFDSKIQADLNIQNVFALSRFLLTAAMWCKQMYFQIQEFSLALPRRKVSFRNNEIMINRKTKRVRLCNQSKWFLGGPTTSDACRRVSTILIIRRRLNAITFFGRAKWNRDGADR